MDDPVVGKITKHTALLEQEVIIWDIPDYKFLFSDEDCFIIFNSKLFEMRNATWSLGICNLATPNKESDITVNINRYRSRKPIHIISYQIILEENGNRICRINNTSAFRDYMLCDVRNPTGVYNLLKERPGDNLKIFFIVHPEFPEDTRTERIPAQVKKGVSILSGDIKDLFVRGENCDFVIKVRDTDFHVHKSILSARSPVLSAMLYHDMDEKNTNMVKIIDCKPEDFKNFLFYVYSGEVEVSWDNVKQMYALGDKYDLADLKRMRAIHGMQRMRRQVLRLHRNGSEAQYTYVI